MLVYSTRAPYIRRRGGIKSIRGTEFDSLRMMPSSSALTSIPLALMDSIVVSSFLSPLLLFLVGSIFLPFSRAESSCVVVSFLARPDIIPHLIIVVFSLFYSPFFIILFFFFFLKI